MNSCLSTATVMHHHHKMKSLLVLSHEIRVVQIVPKYKLDSRQWFDLYTPCKALCNTLIYLFVNVFILSLHLKVRMQKIKLCVRLHDIFFKYFVNCSKCIQFSEKSLFFSSKIFISAHVRCHRNSWDRCCSCFCCYGAKNPIYWPLLQANF